MGANKTAITVLSLMVATVMWAGQAQASRTARQAFVTCLQGSTCISITSCPPAIALLRNPTPANIQILRNNLCGFSGRIPLVCCGASGMTTPPNTPPTIGNTTPTPPTQPTQPSTQPTQPTQPSTEPTRPPPPSGGGENLLPAQCGITSSAANRIFFGEDAPLGAYPWMALIGFTTPSQPQPVFGCGGALITTRYVVTAFHCTDSRFTGNRQLTMVRLGEHNIQTQRDCTTTGNSQRCAPPAQTFSPEQIIRHPDFGTRHDVSDDIALIRLDRDAAFNDFVRPICLPPSGLNFGTFLNGRQVTTAGWGSTERGPNSNILQKVDLPFVARAQCDPHYDNLVTEQICFGGDERRDTCFGDSGGPVFASSSANGRFTLLAVVSFGQQSCGVPGVPAVYTDVSAYRSWIVSNLRP